MSLPRPRGYIMILGAVMVFSSIPFLYYFLPVSLVLYFAVPLSLKNAVLLLVSLFFYAWGEPKYIILMIASMILAYVFGIVIEKTKSKLWLVIAIAAGLVSLLYFKYADFFIFNVNTAFGLGIPLRKIALPVGISFYTFQIISYFADVYRGERAQKSIISLSAYISMFPQLIAGPIVRYSDVARELGSRRHTVCASAYGIRRFVIGLSKKVLIANILGELCSDFITGERTVLYTWLYAVAFGLHIYFDFSGYSDMAIGLGRILGFSFPENFNYPYISSSITEFWRRWHISLGSWFRDYVYIPLGGNRVGKIRWIFNILAVWGLTGFWHGAGWNFIIWGLYFAVFLVLEKMLYGKYLKGILAHIYVVLLIMISFIIFNAPTLGEAFIHIGGLFGASGIPLVSATSLYALKSYGPLLLIGIIGATPIPTLLWHKLNEKPRTILEPALLIIALLVCTAFLVDGSFNPFLYFRF